MRKLFLSLLTLAAVAAMAQTYLPDGARQRVTSNRLLSAGCYTSYDNIYPFFDHTLTPAPDGYTPFYVSTYNRHGSRWLIQPKQYDDPIQFLEQAEKQGGLTKQGKQLLAQLRQIRALSPEDKLGVLTDVGFEQHNALATRMCQHFPEVFCRKAQVSARSSYIPRCVKSMAEEVEVIERIAHIRIPQESGRNEWQSYLAPEMPETMRDAKKDGDRAMDAVVKKHVHPERLLKVLLKHPAEADSAQSINFMRRLFTIAGNMQSHHSDINLFPYFTDDEVYELFQVDNANWYIYNAEAPQTRGVAPWREAPLLRDFILAADTLVGRRTFHGATLRFGHDSCLLPLVALMNLGSVNSQVTDLDTLDHVFRQNEIVPMAGNVQMIFYRPTEGEGDVLVKILLNERETTLPLTPVTGPYYRWTDVRTYWENRLNKYTF